MYNLNAREHNKCLHQGHPSQSPDGQELLFLFSTNGSVTMPQLGELVHNLSIDPHAGSRRA